MGKQRTPQGPRRRPPVRPVASEGHSDTSASTLIAATSADAIPEPDLTEAELPAIEAAAETPEADAVREAIALTK